MAQCYSCGCELIEENKSLEHIIPNVLGGKLKSRDILCKNCNNSFSSVDKSLSENFAFFNVLIAPKTERPTSVKVLVKIDGEDVILKPDMKYTSRFKPEFEERDNFKQVSFRGIFALNDEKEKKDFFKKIQKILKNNGMDISLAKIEEKSKTTKSIPKIESESIVNLDSVILGYLKIALGFCAYKNKIQYVQQEIFAHFKNFNLDDFKQFIRLVDNKKLKNGRLCHHIYLVGDRENSKMFCVISIFNYIDIALILNHNYQQESFQEGYVFDLRKTEKIQNCISIFFEEIKNSEFNFDKIRNDSAFNGKYILNFFVARDINDIPYLLLDLIYYICFININILTKEELKCFIKNSFKKAVENKFLNNFNLYYIEEIAEIAEQNDFYNFYEQRHLRLNQFFSSEKIKSCFSLLETQTKWSSNDIRKIIANNQIADNRWIRILD